MLPARFNRPTRPVACLPLAVALVGLAACRSVPRPLPDSWATSGTEPTVRVMVSHFPADVSPGQRLLAIRQQLPRETLAGVPFRLAVTVTNLAKIPLTDIHYQVALADLELLGAKPEGTMASTVPAIVWQIDHLASGASRQFELRLRRPQAGDLALTSQIRLGRTLSAPLRLRLPLVQLCLSLPGEALAGDTIPALVRLHNAGDGTASDLAVRLDLPDGLAAARSSELLEFVLPTLAAGQTRTLLVPLQANLPGIYAVSASLVAFPEIAAHAEATLHIVQPQLELTAAIAAPVASGVPRRWQCEVRNLGDAAARGLLLVCHLPPGVQVLGVPGGDYAAGQITWNLGTLAPGATTHAGAELLVPAPGPIAATLQASAVGATPVAIRLAADFQPLPILNLAIGKSWVDNQVVYEIVAHNVGSAPALNLVLNCRLASATQPATTRGATAASLSDDTLAWGHIPRLPANAKAIWQVIYDAPPAVSPFNATLTADNHPAPMHAEAPK